MKKFLIFTAILLLISNYGYSQKIDSLNNNFHLGFLGGINQINSFNFDAFGGTKINILSTSVEANFGYSYFQNLTNYNVVNDILYYSHGLYAEGNYFLNSIFYAGIRLNLNVNRVDKDSQTRFDAINGINSPTFFTGIATFAQLGIYHSLTPKISFRMQGQIGIHNFKIAQDAIYFSNSSDRDAQFGIESRSEFLYNLTTGLIFKF